MIGGIISYQGREAEISNIYNLGKITGNKDVKNLIIGGIIARVSPDIEINLTYSYNTGKLETENNISKYFGSIVGDMGKMKLNNCYYLKGTYDVGVGGSETVTGVSQLDSIDKFPNVLEVINGDNAFKEDSNNINNGYPILEWQ